MTGRSKAAGSSLLQTEQEWSARNQALIGTIGSLVREHIRIQTGRGLDVGCQNGAVVDGLSHVTQGVQWWGIDPVIGAEESSPGGVELLHGWSHEIPFAASWFDAVVLANVYEHVPPSSREASLSEIGRVLCPGGILAGQLPNPYFPIESHSRLPLMGWLPLRLQKMYWRLTPVDWEHDFYVVTAKQLAQTATRHGFEEVLIRPFNYPAQVLPQSVRWADGLSKLMMPVMPWAWQFVFRKAAG